MVKNQVIMAKLTIVRLAQSPNQYGSFSYRIVNGDPEEDTSLYGDDENIVYSNQKVGVWNKPIEVEQFLGKSKSGKTYTAFSVDKEMNSFQQRGHTATLAVGAGLDIDKVGMLKMLSELDEQELKVLVMRKQLTALPSPTVSQSRTVNPNGKGIEDAEILEETIDNKEVVKEEEVKG